MLFVRALVDLAGKGIIKGASLLLVSRLVPLAKEEDRVRSIVVGSLIYRLVAKAILRTLALDDILLPY
jgi:hypothetical protein